MGRLKGLRYQFDFVYALRKVASLERRGNLHDLHDVRHVFNAVLLGLIRGVIFKGTKVWDTEIDWWNSLF